MTILFVGANHFHSDKWIRLLASKTERVLVFVDKPFTELPANCRQSTYEAHIRHKLDFRRRANQQRLDALVRADRPSVTFLSSMSKVTGILRFPRPMVFQTWGADVVRDRRLPTMLQAFLVPRVLRQADLVWTSSEFHNQYVRGLTPYPHRVVTVPFGVEDRLASWDGDRGIAGQTVRLFFLKHLLPKYGPMDVVKLAARLDQSRFHFTIAGKGPLKDEIQTALQDASQKNVDMPGFIDRDAVYEQLKRTHIMLSPSHYHSETLGVACLEAAAMGVPSVASRIGGLPYSVRHGQTGLLFSPGNVDEMHECVDRLCEPDTYAECAANARKLVRKYYRLTDIRDRWVFPILNALCEGDEKGVARLTRQVNEVYARLEL